MRPLRFLRLAGNRKPAVVSGGLPGCGSAAVSQVQKDQPIMKASNAEVKQLDLWFGQAKTDVFSVTTLVTPKMAEALLSRNGGNRPVIWTGPVRSVSAYAAAMSRGEWVLNGEPIIISSTGELNDGQHRLHAEMTGSDQLKSAHKHPHFVIKTIYSIQLF